MDADPQRLSDTLRDAARCAREIDVRPFETSAVERARNELVPAVRDAVLRGVDALSETLVIYDVEAEPSEVADLAFMGRMELLSHQQQLENAVVDGEMVSLVSLCGGARRCVLRSLFAVDRALCKREGLALETAEVGAFELAQSLRVRTAYARFRRDLLALGQPELIGIGVYIERATQRLHALIRGEVFSEFRLDDRLMMHRLLARLHTWLDGADGRDIKSGLRLWQDLAGFTSLLVQVNHRNELVEHDRAVVREVYQGLFGGKRPRTSVPEALQHKLDALYGRDESVDGMLDAGLGQFAVEWREPLERLQASLGLSTPPEEEP